MASIESALEELLERLRPGVSRSWIGSPEDDILRLEDIAGRPLPPFYEWFLRSMGRSMGGFSFTHVDCTSAKILSCYEDGVVPPDRQFFLIGYNEDKVVPSHNFYDLDAPARDDARVVQRYARGPVVQIDFETFREMLAWRAMLAWRVEEFPVRCKGWFTTATGDVVAQITPVVDSLGFASPTQTGAFCCVFDRADAAMVCRAAPEPEPARRLFFTIGAADERIIRRALGVIGTEAAVEVTVNKWFPGQ